jgi:hypothetical protein
MGMPVTPQQEQETLESAWYFPVCWRLTGMPGTPIQWLKSPRNGVDSNNPG